MNLDDLLKKEVRRQVYIKALAVLIDGNGRMGTNYLCDIISKVLYENGLLSQETLKVFFEEGYLDHLETQLQTDISHIQTAAIKKFREKYLPEFQKFDKGKSFWFSHSEQRIEALRQMIKETEE